MIACFIAALSNAGGAVFSRQAYAVTQEAGESIDPATAGFQRVTGGTILAGLCLLLVKRKEWRVQSRAPTHLVIEVSRNKWKNIWPWVLVNGLAGQTLGVTCMQLALETTPAGLVLAIIAITPIVVLPFAMVFENERTTAQSVAGGIIAVAGVIGIAWR
jgi:drug/metabolite transporter (DMT)-like permease